MTLADRLWSKADLTGGRESCWEWQAMRIWNGYGRIKVDGRHVLAHRAAYEVVFGAIPDGAVVHHVCNNRACVNPDHLRACSQRENVLAEGSRAVAKRHFEKTHCIHGHEFTEANTYRGVDGRRKQCRICRDKCLREHRARKAA